MAVNEEIKSGIEACVASSQAGEIAFPQVVARLSELGVERYHADYCRAEITFYDKECNSYVVRTLHWDVSIGEPFLANEVEKSVRKSQRNEHSYAEFVCDTMQAGCVGYFVHLCGRQVSYFGRNGETHVERFPPVS
jgi:uncharacterized protein YbcV (DUF1398 family)